MGRGNAHHHYQPERDLGARARGSGAVRKVLKSTFPPSLCEPLPLRSPPHEGPHFLSPITYPQTHSLTIMIIPTSAATSFPAGRCQGSHHHTRECVCVMPGLWLVWQVAQPAGGCAAPHCQPTFRVFSQLSNLLDHIRRADARARLRPWSGLRVCSAPGSCGLELTPSASGQGLLQLRSVVWLQREGKQQERGRAGPGPVACP